MNENVSVYTEITDKTYQPGQILERPGKTAKVIAAAFQDVKGAGRRFTGYTCEITTVAVDGSVRVQNGLLRRNDLEVPPERGGWHPRKAGDEAPTPNVTVITTKDETVTVEYKPETQALMIAQLQSDLNDANKLILMKDEQIEKLQDARDSAIEELNQLDARAVDRNETNREQIEIAAKRFDELHTQGAEKFGTLWLTANLQVNRLVDEEYVPEGKFGEVDIRIKTLLTETAMSIAQLMETNASLTEQLSSALASHVAPEAMPARADVLTAPCKEFDIVKKATPADLNRMDREGWEIQHMQWEEGALNVVYFRHVQPEPVQPGPRKAVETVPGSYMYIPAADPIPESAEGRANRDLQAAMAEALNFRNALLARSPMPDFVPLAQRRIAP